MKPQTYLVVERTEVVAWCDTLAEAQDAKARLIALQRFKQNPANVLDFSIFAAEEIKEG